MWQNLREFASHYKTTIMKSALALFLVFMVVQYNTFGKRSSAHYLHLQIKNGFISNLCVAATEKIASDRKGVFAYVDERKIYIPPEWATITRRENLYIAIVMDSGRYHRQIYEIDGRNARLLLESDKLEGCRSFVKINRKLVS